MTGRFGAGATSTSWAPGRFSKVRSVASVAHCERVVTEDVAWARHGARHTFEFENVIAWWCQRADRTSVSVFWRCDWAR